MAEASTARYKHNEPLSVFDGIPVTAKDAVRVVRFPFKQLILLFTFVLARNQLSGYVCNFGNDLVQL